VLHVESDYYRGWAAFFEQRIGANTTVFPGNETVRVELVSPTERSSVDSGLISVGTGSPIDTRGNAGDPTFVDSYDSGIGPYSTSSGSEGSVRSPSGLNLGGESFIKGDVNTGGVVDFDGNNNTSTATSVTRASATTGTSRGPSRNGRPGTGAASRFRRSTAR
jgi:hypothetical protein